MKKFFTCILFVMLLTACLPQEPVVENDSDANAQNVIEATDTIAPTSAPSCEIQSDLKTDWEIIFCEEFDDNSWDWWTGSDISDLRTMTATLEGGKYTIDVIGNAHSNYSSGVIQWFYIPDAENFTISIDGEIYSNNRDVSWGINFWGNDLNFYSFGIGKEGWYFLDMLENDDWKTLINTKSNNAIYWDGTNNLSIVVEDDKFMFYVNNTLIDSYESDYQMGDEISLFIQLAEGASATYMFDNILLRSND